MNDRLHTARTSITALVLAMSMAMATVPATGLAAVDATTQTTATTSAAQGGGTDKATAKSRDVGKGTTDGQTGTGTDSETARGRGAGHKGRGADGTTKSNEEVVAGLTGLSDAEREELLALMNKRDALSEGQKLSDADRARMSELRQKARHAKAQEAIEADTSLTDAQKSELKTKLEAATGERGCPRGVPRPWWPPSHEIGDATRHDIRPCGARFPRTGEPCACGSATL